MRSDALRQLALELIDRLPERRFDRTAQLAICFAFAALFGPPIAAQCWRVVASSFLSPAIDRRVELRSKLVIRRLTCVFVQCATCAQQKSLSIVCPIGPTLGKALSYALYPQAVNNSFSTQTSDIEGLIRAMPRLSSCLITTDWGVVATRKCYQVASRRPNSWRRPRPPQAGSFITHRDQPREKIRFTTPDRLRVRSRAIPVPDVRSLRTACVTRLVEVFRGKTVPSRSVGNARDDRAADRLEA